MKYKYSRKECNKEIETLKRIFTGSQIMPGGWLETVEQYLHATQLMLLATTDEIPIFSNKTISPQPDDTPNYSKDRELIFKQFDQLWTVTNKQEKLIKKLENKIESLNKNDL